MGNVDAMNTERRAGAQDKNGQPGHGSLDRRSAPLKTKGLEFRLSEHVGSSVMCLEQVFLIQSNVTRVYMNQPQC
jgi:hypothetical protein